VSWRALTFLINKVSLTALTLITLIPYVVSILKLDNIDYLLFKVTIFGAIIFISCILFFYRYCPVTVRDFSKDDYFNECMLNNVNPHECFSFLEELNEMEIKAKFADSDHLYPIQKGLQHSQLETIRLCSAIEYEHLNTRDLGLRMLLFVIFFFAIYLMNLPGILRLMTVYS